MEQWVAGRVVVYDWTSLSDKPQPFIELICLPSKRRSVRPRGSPERADYLVSSLWCSQTTRSLTRSSSHTTPLIPHRISLLIQRRSASHSVVFSFTARVRSFC